MNRPFIVGRKKRIGEILREGGFITEVQMKSALEASAATGKKLGQILIEQGHISPEGLATALSFQFGVPVADLRQIKIDPEAVRLVPEHLAREHSVMPLAIDGDVLRVAMEDPSNLAAIDTLSAVTGKQIRPVLPLHGGIEQAIGSNYRLTADIQKQVNTLISRQAPSPMAAGAPTPEPMLAAEQVAQAPIVQALDMVIRQAVKDRASDIHVEPQQDSLRIRYRIDGVLHDAVSLPLGIHAALLSRLKVIASMNIAEKRRPQDGHFNLNVGGRDVDFRVATADTTRGEKAVIRVLDKSISLTELKDLGMQRNALETYERLLESPYGMILVSGPTGSGKTTTLYSSLMKLDRHRQNIMTIEDPVEYHFEGIHQIQVNRQADITFAGGLRAIMRMDPDLILVGEIRDSETATTAVQAALTGHLVLSSIHANDSAGAIVRLLDLGVEPFMVTSAVIGTVAQRLVRRVCPYCRQIVRVSAEESMAYSAEMSEVRNDFYYGRGCNFCSQTGFLGRMGVFEVLTMTDQLRQLIAKGAPGTEVRASAVREGMTTMRRDGMLKARDGVTTPKEVIRHVFTIA
ncbi:MAG: type II/IV secretion system protein [Chloroflexi bacterium]|nr:type II/IV secretion system protein [Chloroflexota bacterium]